jgi:hypothetical protein
MLLYLRRRDNFGVPRRRWLYHIKMNISEQAHEDVKLIELAQDILWLLHMVKMVKYSVSLQPAASKWSE